MRAPLIILSILIVCLYVLLLAFPTKQTFTQQPPPIELVISHFKEDTTWLQYAPFNQFKQTIYHKGLARAHSLRLPNVGREGHTYLYHIINNYENLADVTIFLPGSCQDSPAHVNKKEKTRELVDLVMKTNDTVLLGPTMSQPIREAFYDFQLDEWEGTNADNSRSQSTGLKPCPERPFGRWYDANFPPGTGDVRVVCFAGIFAVSRGDIRRHPKSFYEKLIKYVDDHPNPEAGHFLERAWGAVFAPK
jgi:Protein of unknown function (DUF3431)